MLTIGKQTALAIENAKFQQEQLERRRIAEALRDSISILNSTEEILLAVAFADQAALVLEVDYFQDRLQEAAAVEERNRLARDLHDAVTQTLFSASMIAGVLPDLWEENVEAGRYRLRQLENLTRGALAEMRAMLLELRPQGLIEGRIQDLLRHLVDAAAGRCKAEFSLNVHGPCDLPTEVKVVCYRIVQEALHNVIKHAEASHVLVALRCEEGAVRLQVMDDGRGFDPDGITSDHMGVCNMRERAAAVGGTFALNTGEGEGTQLTFTWQAEHT